MRDEQLKVLDNVISNTKCKLNGLAKPIREKLDTIKKEQNYSSINADHFFKELEGSKIVEPLEDLLKMV